MCRNKRTRLLESSSGSWTRSLIQLLGIALIQTFTRPFIVRMKSQPPFFEIFFLPKYFFFNSFAYCVAYIGLVWCHTCLQACPAERLQASIVECIGFHTHSFPRHGGPFWMISSINSTTPRLFIPHSLHPSIWMQRQQSRIITTILFLFLSSRRRLLPILLCSLRSVPTWIIEKSKFLITFFEIIRKILHSLQIMIFNLRYFSH